MRKQFSKEQIKWMMIVGLLFSLLTNLDDVVHGFRDGLNGVVTIDLK